MKAKKQAKAASTKVPTFKQGWVIEHDTVYTYIKGNLGERGELQSTGDLQSARVWESLEKAYADYKLWVMRGVNFIYARPVHWRKGRWIDGQEEDLVDLLRKQEEELKKEARETPDCRIMITLPQEHIPGYRHFWDVSHGGLWRLGAGEATAFIDTNAAHYVGKKIQCDEYLLASVDQNRKVMTTSGPFPGAAHKPKQKTIVMARTGERTRRYWDAGRERWMFPREYATKFNSDREAHDSVAGRTESGYSLIHLDMAGNEIGEEYFPSYKTGTQTGRASSAEPNLSSLPKVVNMSTAAVSENREWATIDKKTAEEMGWSPGMATVTAQQSVQCCERDTDHDGNCPDHSAPGVLRIRELNRVFDYLVVGCDTTHRVYAENIQHALRLAVTATSKRGEEVFRITEVKN